MPLVLSTPSDRSGFDPALAGTPETLWSRHLQSVASWVPAAGPLLVVGPHPDDEVLGAGGLIHFWTRAGLPVTVLSVTDGEAAYPGCKGLDLIRREELKAALHKLCSVDVPIVRLALPDGRLSAFRRPLRDALLDLIEPSTTIIAPYEQDGHPDHDAVGAVCLEIARARGVRLARYPIWAWHQMNPMQFHESQWGKFALEPAACRAKAAALHCFGSQMDPRDCAPIVPVHVLDYFKRPYEAFLL